MSKTFRLWKIDEPQFLPPTVQDFVAEDHLARFVVSLVTEELDLVEITASYLGEKGQPPFQPAMMVALLLYAYCCGIYSSRRIAKACRERVDFMSIVALDPPDFRTICEFRKRHLKALSGLFVQVLKLCEKAGLVKLGHVAFGGTKIRKHKAMSYERMEARARQLEAEVAKWLATAEAADSEEDKLYGLDKQGDEMPVRILVIVGSYCRQQFGLVDARHGPVRFAPSLAALFESLRFTTAADLPGSLRADDTADA